MLAQVSEDMLVAGLATIDSFTIHRHISSSCLNRLNCFFGKSPDANVTIVYVFCS